MDDTTNIRFVVRLVELWVRKSHTPNDVKMALMNKGEAEFKAARNLAQEGQFDAAVKALRDLLTINPNHLGAQLTLAQTLLDQKKLKEAVQAFEDAFWMDEDVGRDGLIDARLAMGQTLEDEKQFLEAAVHYRRVLELKPDEYRVQEKLRILYDQGYKAAATGNWEKAAFLFERITNIDRDYKDAHDRRDNAFRQAAAQPSTAQSVQKLSTRFLIIVTAVILIMGGIVGGWFIWGEELTQDTLTPTQAIAQVVDTPTTQSSLEPTVGPATATTLESTQTSRLPLYPEPQLVAPPNLDLQSGNGHFKGRTSQPRLEWEPIPDLDSNDFYVVYVWFPKRDGFVFVGASVKENFWDVEQRIYDEIASQERDFHWFVVVSHFEGKTFNPQGIPEPVGEGVEVSPRSEVRTFRWD